MAAPLEQELAEDMAALLRGYVIEGDGGVTRVDIHYEGGKDGPTNLSARVEPAVPLSLMARELVAHGRWGKPRRDPVASILMIVPTRDLVRTIGDQATPARDVRVVVTTPSAAMLDHIRGIVFDAVFVMPGCRSGPWARVDNGPTVLAMAKAMHRGRGPWIELNPNYRHEVP